MLASGRIAGIDLARALAIIGMFSVHVRPVRPDGLAGLLYALPHGRASILFVLLAGIGVSLLAGSRRRSAAEARLRLAWRAAVLLPMGLALQVLRHSVSVILQHYAALFLVGIAALRLPDRWLLALTVASTLLGPVGYLAGRTLDPQAFARGTVSLGDPPAEVMHGLLLSGAYPLVTWAAPFLLGMWLGRRDLRSSGLRRRLMIFGALVTLLAFAVASVLEAAFLPARGPVGWDWLLTDAPHSQMPLWLIGAMGSATLMLGLALVVADAFPRLTWPLAAMGQLALTVYVAHLVALHLWRDAFRPGDTAEATGVVAAMVAIAMAACVAWRALLPQGPIEGVLQMPWRIVAALRRPP